jgi:hypothetical protein
MHCEDHARRAAGATQGARDDSQPADWEVPAPKFDRQATRQQFCVLESLDSLVRKARVPINVVSGRGRRLHSFGEAGHHSLVQRCDAVTVGHGRFPQKFSTHSESVVECHSLQH